MAQEPHKSNSVLIVIAIIGVIGTIVASVIGAIANYNIEKFRQEAELTKIALVSLATQSGATQVSMASTISAPTAPAPTIPVLTISAPTISPPTITPYPTNTMAPTITSIPSATPTIFIPPANGILFQDNFDKGFNSSWHQSSGNWITANGRLTLIFEEFKFMWLNLNIPQTQHYRIEANIDRSAGQVLIVVNGNTIGYLIGFYGKNCWQNDFSGNAECIVGEADRDLARKTINLELEVNNNEYIAMMDGAKAQSITMKNQSNGGISVGIYCQRGFACPSIDNFKVTYLP